ncbi:hypothetical protein K438DRAFT_1979025 [Mycena galopus ATCC 62051]|nr:hypothetical protein K438DRAFT_1979025 [Mycena galopus ATCC 62051]
MDHFCDCEPITETEVDGSRADLIERLSPPFVLERAVLERTGTFYGRHLGSSAAAEVCAAEEWLPIAKHERDYLEYKAMDMQRQYRQARIDLMLVNSMIDNHRYIVSILRQVPEEVLRECMRWAILSLPRRLQKDAARTLATVCTAWRNTVHADPALWNFFAIDPHDAWLDTKRDDRDTKRWAELQEMLDRIKNYDFDLALDGEDDTPEVLLESLVALSHRWRRVEVKNYEQYEVHVNSYGGRLLQLLERLPTQPTGVQHLRFQGARNTGWGHPTINAEEDRTVAWFREAEKLTVLELSTVRSPEKVFDVKWEGLRKYSEDYCRRTAPPLASHFQRMQQLVELRLRNSTLPNKTHTDVIAIPTVTLFELTMDLPNLAIGHHGLLQLFEFKGLRSLELRGTSFQKTENNAGVQIAVVDSALDFWRSSAKAPWQELTISMATGLRDNRPWRLLTDIPTLKTFTVEHAYSHDFRDGLLTNPFLDHLLSETATVHTLRLEGGQAPDFQSSATEERWTAKLCSVLEYQFARNLRTVDLTRGHAGACTISEATENTLKKLAEGTKERTIKLCAPANKRGWAGEGWGVEWRDTNWWG